MTSRLYGEGCHGFCDNTTTKALVIKSVTMGERVEKGSDTGFLVQKQENNSRVGQK